MFKHKNKKVIQSDTRITLDAKHNEMIKSFKDEQRNLKKYQQELKEKQKRLEELQNKTDEYIDPLIMSEQFTLENSISNINDKIEKIKTMSKETEYFVATGSILYDYYNDIEDVALKQEESPKKEDKKKGRKKVEVKVENGNISSFFGGEGKRAIKMSDFVQSATNFDRAEKLDEYLSKIDKSYGLKARIESKIDFCRKCKENYDKDFEMIINHIEGFMSCTNCGYMEYVIIESDKPNYKDPPPEATYFAYKRTNHLNEILNQIQAKESTEIPENVLDAVKDEVRKERIDDLTKLTNQKVRYFLRKLGMNKYYEHVAHIINRLNGLPPPIITKQIEDKIRIMFSAVNSVWGDIAKKDKKNFLNYHYVLFKFVELLGHDEYKVLFPLLKSRDKIAAHDLIWKDICDKLGWEYIKTI